MRSLRRLSTIRLTVSKAISGAPVAPDRRGVGFADHHVQELAYAYQ